MRYVLILAMAAGAAACETEGRPDPVPITEACEIVSLAWCQGYDECLGELDDLAGCAAAFTATCERLAVVVEVPLEAVEACESDWRVRNCGPEPGFGPVEVCEFYWGDSAGGAGE